MKIKLFASMAFLIILIGCASSRKPTEIQPTLKSSSTTVLTSTLEPAHTRTPKPSFTSTSTITSTPLFTPQPGFQIWDQGSMLSVYTIQYPKDEWIENGDQLTNATLTRCFLAEHGGTNMCMLGGCPAPTEVTLGDIAYSKMAFENSSAIYTSSPYFALSFEVHSFNDDPTKDAECIEEAEQVLDTLQIRPERGCVDRAAFVADITVPDNTVIPAGTKFIKTWRIKNVGTCTWTKGSYTLVVMGRSSGTEADWEPLQENVEPQQTIDLSIELPAPPIQGTARWEGALKNEFGDMFGLGDGPYTDMFGRPFWVQILVVPAPIR